MSNLMFFIPELFIDAAKSAALRIAGGYTAHALAEGAWQDDTGKVHFDRIIPLQVFTNAVPEIIDTMSGILREGFEMSIGYTLNGVPMLDNL